MECITVTVAEALTFQKLRLFGNQMTISLMSRGDQVEHLKLMNILYWEGEHLTYFLDRRNTWGVEKNINLFI